MRCEASGGHSWLAAWPRLLSPLGDGVLAVKQRPATSLLRFCLNSLYHRPGWHSRGSLPAPSEC